MPQYGVDDREPLERLRQVERTALVGRRRAAGRLHRGVADQRLGEVHQPAVVGVRGVELEHRELGVVPRAHAFVAEVAVDLEHALEAADDEPLQVELRRDAQEHRHVERVVMRRERLRGRAAGDRMQHRRLDLEEAVAAHEVADRRDRAAARDERRARLVADDQVDVALPVLHLLVGEPVELVGQRPQRLRQEADRRRLDGQLAGPRLEQRPRRRDDVAEVEALEVGVRVGADGVGRDVELDRAGPVPDRREAGLAHHALEHHAARDRHRRGLGFEVGRVARVVRVVQVARAMRRREVVRKRDAGRADLRELRATLRDDLVRVDGGRGRRDGRVHAGSGRESVGARVTRCGCRRSRSRRSRRGRDSGRSSRRRRRARRAALRPSCRRSGGLRGTSPDPGRA